MGTEHILLGLVTEGEGIAAIVLASLRVTAEAARREVLSLRPPSPGDDAR
ncbi:MAG: hypothetical protein M3301_04265 [Chloroflexota bacterium]|nr:hypothetical protein [Chloroflexota bacterium]